MVPEKNLNIKKNKQKNKYSGSYIRAMENSVGEMGSSDI